MERTRQTSALPALLFQKITEEKPLISPAFCVTFISMFFFACCTDVQTGQQFF